MKAEAFFFLMWAFIWIFLEILSPMVVWNKSQMAFTKGYNVDAAAKFERDWSIVKGRYIATYSVLQ